MNCGYNALKYILEASGISDFTALEAYQTHKEMDFYDFYVICLAYQIKASAYHAKKIAMVPCIVQLKIGKYKHFVVVLDYQHIVTYLDVDNRKHYLFKIVFNLFFSGNIFVIGCVKRD